MGADGDARLVRRDRPLPADTGVSGKSSAARWNNEIKQLVRDVGFEAKGRRLGAGVLSASTQETREKVLLRCMRELWKLGFKLESVSALRDKHITALVSSWESRHLSASSIQNRLTHLRKLAEWIGKGGMVRPACEYASDPDAIRRTTTAQYDHSWRAAGVDAAQMIQFVEKTDPRAGLQLKLCHAFMLRRREAVMFRPWVADRGSHIVVEEGTKGGRLRIVDIVTPYQRAVLDEAKAFVESKMDHIGNKSCSLKQNLKRFDYVMAKCGLTRDQLGVTAHGLRHEGLGDLFESIAEIPAPIRSDNVRESLAAADPEKLREARRKVAEVAGHSRLSISGSYIGGLMGRERLEKVRKDQLVRKFSRMLDLQSRASPTDAERHELNGLQRELVRQMGYEAVFPEPSIEDSV